MIKNIHNKYIKIWLVICLMACVQFAKAQTEEDAIMIPKNYICPAFMYSYGSWDHYWEGTFKRNNLNLGTVSNKMYTGAIVYGISDKLNAIVSAPYITTNASAGTLQGQKGIQDLRGTIKYLPYEGIIGKGVFSVYAIAGYSLPLSNYVADFLPVAIGLRSKTASLRGMVDYQVKNFFVTASGQYNLRSDITIDRSSYYTTMLIYSNRVYMPNVAVYNGRAGYRSAKFRAEFVAENSTTLGGFDIRKNDSPFPSNRMNMTSLGAAFKYSFNSGLEFSAGGSHVIAGRNVGQTNMFSGGIDYLFSLSSKKKTNKAVVKEVNKKQS